MSVSTSQSNELGADVLLMIFQQLEGEDLENCEAVCRQWRDILVTGTPWRRLFLRNKENLPLWRKAQKILESNQLTLRTDQYRNVCAKILQVNRNLRTGNFTKAALPLDENSATCEITVNDDYVAWKFVDRRGCAFLDTESMEIKEIRLPEFEDFHEMLLFWRDHDAGKLEIVDPTNRWIVNALDEDEQRYEHSFHRIVFGSKILILLYDLFQAGRVIDNRIKIWKMGQPPVLLREETEEGGFFFEQVDERFIVATENADIPDYSEYRDGFHFTSTETFEETRSLSLLSAQRIYHRGLLFYIRKKEFIRILDVASGTHFNDLRLPFRSKDKPFNELSDMWHSTDQKDDERSAVLLYRWASSNSSVIVIGWRYWNKEKSARLSNLSVYDLQAMKKPNSDCHLLYTLQFECYMDSFVMDESELTFIGTDGKNNRFVTVLKFADFNFAERKSPFLKGNPGANEGIKMKIIRDPYLE